MDIDELAREVGEAPRMIRHLISLNVVPPPEGGRKFADYGPVHVAAIRRFQALRAAGYSPAQITAVFDFVRAASAAGVTALPLAPGVTLVIDPTALGQPPPDPGTLGSLAALDLERFLAAMPPMPKENDDAA